MDLSGRGWQRVVGLVLVAGTGACAEGGAGASSTGSWATGGAGTSSGSVSTTSDAVTGSGRLVINEVSAKGGDWVELSNAGTAEVLLGGYGLCDEDDSGACDTSTLVRFPPGTRLAPGEYLLVLGDQSVEAGVGPYDTCLSEGGPSSCFYASWKVSASEGEHVWLLDANDLPVDQALYPSDGVEKDQTWARLPDGTGAFAAAKATPGAANRAP